MRVPHPVRRNVLVRYPPAGQPARMVPPYLGFVIVRGTVRLHLGGGFPCDVVCDITLHLCPCPQESARVALRSGNRRFRQYSCGSRGHLRSAAETALSIRDQEVGGSILVPRLDFSLTPRIASQTVWVLRSSESATLGVKRGRLAGRGE
jgi:hypothetical protein